MLFQPAILNEEGYSLSVNDINDFPLHWHNDIEILYCISGGFGISVRGKSYDVFAGDAVLCGSCEPHMVEGRAGGAVAVIIRLGSLFCGARIYREIIKRRLDMPILSGSEYIKEQLERLLSLCEKRDALSTLEMRGCIYSVLARLLSELPFTEELSDNHRHRIAVTMKIQRALDLVATKYSEELSLGDVASASGYEKSAFCRMFKSATGTTFHKYLNEYRIKKSMPLIYDGNLGMAEIAELVGFSEQKNFSRIFKEVVGVSPTEYKRRGADGG